MTFPANMSSLQAEVAEKSTMSLLIYDRARVCGLDTDPNKIIRQFKWWIRWYRGDLATGYLMRMTGVRNVSS